MDGVAWMELVDGGLLKLPPRTILGVTTRSKGDKTKTVYFGEEEFARALQYYGGMAMQDIIREAYITAHTLKRAEDLTELNLLNRSGFADESVPLLNYREYDEG